MKSSNYVKFNSPKTCGICNVLLNPFETDSMCKSCNLTKCVVCLKKIGTRSKCGHFLCPEHMQRGWISWTMRGLGWLLSAGYYCKNEAKDIDRHPEVCKYCNVYPCSKGPGMSAYLVPCKVCSWPVVKPLNYVPRYKNIKPEPVNRYKPPTWDLTTPKTKVPQSTPAVPNVSIINKITNAFRMRWYGTEPQEVINASRQKEITNNLIQRVPDSMYDISESLGVESGDYIDVTKED
jgi:hypothetical protein